jgi:hypothetical protein
MLGASLFMMSSVFLHSTLNVMHIFLLGCFVPHNSYVDLFNCGSAAQSAQGMVGALGNIYSLRSIINVGDLIQL